MLLTAAVPSGHDESIMQLLLARRVGWGSIGEWSIPKDAAGTGYLKSRL